MLSQDSSSHHMTNSVGSYNDVQNQNRVAYAIVFELTSMSTGGIFSPPAVMMSSLMRPVIRTKPLQKQRHENNGGAGKNNELRSVRSFHQQSKQAGEPQGRKKLALRNRGKTRWGPKPCKTKGWGTNIYTTQGDKKNTIIERRLRRKQWTIFIRKTSFVSSSHAPALVVVERGAS